MNPRLNRKLAKRRLREPNLPPRDPLFLLAVGLLIAIFVSFCSSCSPLDPGGYRETSGAPETRRFTVIETTPIDPPELGRRSYSTTSIRTVIVR